MYKLFFSVDILNIETFISITNIPPVWKTRDGLTVLQTLRTCTSTVFSITMTQPTEKTWEISTRHGKQRITSHAHKFSGLLWSSVNWINNTAIIYNHAKPVYQLHRKNSKQGCRLITSLIGTLYPCHISYIIYHTAQVFSRISA